MSNASSNVNVSDGGLFFVLFIVFLVLKLTGVIAWSWWWVTAPLWGPAAFVVLAFGILFLIALLARR